MTVRTRLAESPAARRPAGLSANAGVFVALSALTSGLLFLYGVLPAHRLPPAEFGRFTSLFGIVVILGALFTAVQTYVAGVVAANHGHFRATSVSGPLRRHTRAALAVVTGIAILSAVALPGLLDTSAVSVALVLGTAVLTAAFAICLGVLQGAERFAALGGVNAAQAGLRLAACAFALWVLDGTVEAVLGATLVSMVPSVWLAATLARASVRTLPPDSPRGPSPTSGRALATLLVTVVAGFPAVGDVVLARMVLAPADAGSLAIVAIVGRIVVFGASIAATLAYPRLVRSSSERAAAVVSRRATVAVAAAALVAVAVALAVPDVALRLVSGESDPATRALLGPYTIACAVYATGVPLAYHLLARAGPRRFVPLMLAGLLGMAAVITTARSALHVTVTIAAAGLVLVVSAATRVRASAKAIL